jgi:hypothetical protein
LRLASFPVSRWAAIIHSEKTALPSISGLTRRSTSFASLSGRCAIKPRSAG